MRKAAAGNDQVVASDLVARDVPKLAESAV